MLKNKSYKTNISPMMFYIYITLIFLFVMVFSINFLINQFIEKHKLIQEVYDKYATPGVNLTQEESQKLYDHARKVWNLWSLPTYFGGLSTILIFFVFVLFGRVKVRYGYFFRTIWSIIFIGAGVFVFFIVGIPLWQKIINFILVIALATVALIDLVRVNKNQEQIKFEIRQEWRNKKNNKNVKEV